MKRILLMAASLLCVFSLSSCSSSKKVMKAPLSEGETEIALPLSEPQYNTDAKFWRATQVGTSRDISLAKKIAMQNTRQELAALVQNEVKSVIENYGQNAAVHEQNDNEALYKELTRTVIDQQLNGVEIAGIKVFRLANGDYRCHTCLQMSKEKLEEKISEVLAQDKRLLLEFDKEQFKKVFDEEMSKCANKK
ncbi:hypothetical protein [Alistipes sp.]|uniref:hypothetical protein n=1 Tax=Alistipes sp. TaxID=1872444 RepID=UPI0025C0B542|nr:hypothetical protein [Alistipes sp.]